MGHIPTFVYGVKVFGVFMSIHDFLIERGYIGPVVEQFKDCCVYYHKRKIGVQHHQFLVREYDLSPLKTGMPKSYEVSRCYECKDGT